MPKNSKVHRCVEQVMAQGKDKPTAIRICQASTGQSYMTGRPAKKGARKGPGDAPEVY